MFMGPLPHIQVAVSLKTRYHRNPRHLWSVNDIIDIDAVSVAYAYCEAVFPDKAVRNALLSSRELRTIGTFVPRHPGELADWLSALPNVIAPRIAGPTPLEAVDGGRRLMLARPAAYRRLLGAFGRACSPPVGRGCRAVAETALGGLRATGPC
jgi:hypothetical protein